VDFKPFEEIPPSTTDTTLQENSKNEQSLTDKSISQFTSSEKILIDTTDQSCIVDTNPSMMIDKLISTSLSDKTKSSCFPLSTTNEPTNLFDSRSISHHTPLHLVPQIHTPDSNIFTPPHQHFPYPFFAPPPPGKTNCHN
jgi:hypothetical protein